MIGENLDFIIVLVRVVVSLVALAFALSCLRRLGSQRQEPVWRLMLIAALAVFLAEAADLVWLHRTPQVTVDLLRLVAVVALAAAVGLKSAAIFPLLRERQVIGALFIAFRREHRFDQNDRRLLSTLAAHAALAMHNAELYEAVERLSVTDALTGLANRRRFDQELNDELRRARRYDKPLALILFDLDHFRTVNDRYGHPVGDRVLKTVAEILRQFSRDTDIAVRLGGDEFALILPETEEKEAVRVAQRVRRQVASTCITGDGWTLSATLSAGVTGSTGQALPPDPAMLFRLADQALYRAKEQGHHRAVLGQISEGKQSG